MNIPDHALEGLRMNCNLDKALRKHSSASCAYCAHRRGEADVVPTLAVARLDTEALVLALYEARDDGDAAILALAKATIREVQEEVDELTQSYAVEAQYADPIRGE